MSKRDSIVDGRTVTLDSALGQAIDHYRATTPKSHRLYKVACESLPGGNTRTILHYDPYPVSITKGSGVQLWDADGNLYTDFLGEYSASLYGHSNPKIQAAIKAALDEGIVLCAPNEYEVELADLVCQRFPSCDRVRFCNSGTEGNLMAISAARAYTGRTHVMVFNGAYHGGVFNFVFGGSEINAPHPLN